MKIAIYGVGGAGGVFGAQLVRAGEEVAFVARGAQLAAMSDSGLVVERPDDEIRIERPRVTGDPREIGAVDLVILGVKTWQVAAAAAAVRPMIAPGTAVLPLQNGVEAADELARELGEEHALVGLCGTISYVVAPGRVKNLGGPNFIRFAERDGSASARCRRVLETMRRAGIDAEIPADIHRSLWEKFLFVVSSGGVGAVTRSTIGEIRALPETRDLLERAMAEIHEVGKARGVRLPDDAVERAMGFADRLPEGGTTSLQRDLAEGRPSELEAWNGAVVRLGKAAGVPTPVHDFCYRALVLTERRNRSGHPGPAQAR